MYWAVVCNAFANNSILEIGIFSVSPVAYLCKADFGIPVAFDNSPYDMLLLLISWSNLFDISLILSPLIYTIS